MDTLEHRLTKERNKLQAMMQHLQMKHSPDTTTPTVGKVPVSVSVISQKENIQIEPASPMRSPKQEIVSQPASVQPTVQVTVPATVTSAPPQIQVSFSSIDCLGLSRINKTKNTSVSNGGHLRHPLVTVANCCAHLNASCFSKRARVDSKRAMGTKLGQQDKMKEGDQFMRLCQSKLDTCLGTRR